MQAVEFIESYVKDDFGDYQWNDNHGQLVRCKDCVNYDNGSGVGWCSLFSKLLPNGDWLSFEESDFCSYGERKKE